MLLGMTTMLFSCKGRSMDSTPNGETVEVAVVPNVVDTTQVEQQLEAIDTTAVAPQPGAAAAATEAQTATQLIDETEQLANQTEAEATAAGLN